MEHRQSGPGDSVQHTIQEVTGRNTEETPYTK